MTTCNYIFVVIVLIYFFDFVDSCKNMDIQDGCKYPVRIEDEKKVSSESLSRIGARII